MEFEGEKEKVGMFKRFGIAIAKPKQYKKLAQQKTSSTVGTFAFVSLIQTIALLIMIFIFISSLLSMGNEFIEKLPDFSISQKGFTSEMKEPFNFADDNLMVFVNIDSNKTLEEIKNDNTDKIYAVEDYIIIGTDGVIIKNDGEIEDLYFKDFEEISFKKSDIVKVVSDYFSIKILIIVLLIFGIFAWLFIWVFKLLGGLIFALIGMLIAEIYKKQLSFKELYNIAMYSGLTTTILSIILIFAVFIIPGWIFIKLVIIIMYMIFGIKYIDNNDEEENKDKNIDSNNDEENKDKNIDNNVVIIGYKIEDKENNNDLDNKNE